MLGGIEARGKDLAEAVSLFRKVITIDKQEVRAYLGLSSALIARNKSADAEKALQQAVAIDQKALNPRIALFRFYGNAKRFDRAETELKEAIEFNPQNPDLYVLLGNFYFSRQKEQAAEAACSFCREK